jgi:hypothetical protein
MPDADEKQFESYLKSFRPVAPEPLPLRTKAYSDDARRRSALAATAVACLAAVALVSIVLSRSPQRANDQVGSQPANDVNPYGANNAKRAEISTPVLTRLALDDDYAFDQLMTDKVQSQFPSMKSEESALRVLAKE